MITYDTSPGDNKRQRKQSNESSFNTQIIRMATTPAAATNKVPQSYAQKSNEKYKDTED